MLLIQCVLHHLSKTLKTFSLARVHQYTSVLSTEVPLTCYGRSEAVSEGNGPVRQEEEIGCGQPAPVDEFREIKSHFDNLKELMRRLEQHLMSQEQDARQPRLAMEEADGHANTKTRELTEGAATAVQAMRGDDFSVRRVEPGSNTNSTSFGVKAEPPVLPCRDDVVVESSDIAPVVSHPWRCAHQQPLVA